MKKIITAIEQAGLPIIVSEDLFDGTFHRFGDRKKVWFVGQKHTIAGKTCYKASFGDVRNPILNQTVRESSHDLTEAEVAEFQRVLDAIEEERKAERQAKWEEMAELAEATFNGCEPEFKPTAYSLRKGIMGGYGARNMGVGGQDICVPLRDVDGNVRNLQRISPHKDANGNDKSFLEGAQVDGLFSISNESECGPLSETSHLVLCEGWATAASVSAILKSANAERTAVVSCANAGNIGKVAEAIRARFPALLFTIAADNDYQKTNAGVSAGVETARRFGAKVVVPPPEDGITDWNDYLLKHGLDQARMMFYSDQSQLVDLSTPSTNKDKKKKLNDHQVASIVAQSFGNLLLRETAHDYFLWVGTHWVHQDPEVFPLRIQQKLNQVAGSGKSADVKAAWAQFQIHFPVTPRGLFDIVRWKANFLNGTLHCNPETKKLFFHEHRKEDFMTTTIPFDVPLPFGEVTQELCSEIFEKYPKNSLFFQYIHNTFGEAQMADILQAYSAAIIPSFSRIFMAIGNPGSGKSTMAKILMAFLHKENISSVQPCNFKDFHLHPMVGKIANIVPELELKIPMVDNVVKALIDQEPIAVNRKGVKIIHAILSPLQIWCGNDLPKSLDGASGAYERRMTIVRTREDVKNLPQDDHFVVRLIRDSGVQVLMGALVEFFKLLEQGGFKQTERSLRDVKEFQRGSDTIGQFLQDIDDGEFNTSCNEFRAQNNGSGTFQCQTLYTVFVEWCKANGKFQTSYYEFRRQMKRQGFEAQRKRISGSGRGENPVWVFNLKVEQVEGSPI